MCRAEAAVVVEDVLDVVDLVGDRDLEHLAGRVAETGDVAALTDIPRLLLGA